MCWCFAGYSASLLAERLKELEEEEAAHRLSLSQPYAELILQYSSFKKPQRDRYGQLRNEEMGLAHNRQQVVVFVLCKVLMWTRLDAHCAARIILAENCCPMHGLATCSFNEKALRMHT